VKSVAPLDIATVGELIDFQAGRISEAVALEQLRGATAVHNILGGRGYAYLADEVGMGKTYVALGVVGLLRFFHPDLRVLFITPRHNIQAKWEKELRNFVRNNWRLTDQRVRSFDGAPTASVVRPGSLIEWARESVLDPARDVVLRMSSFGWALADDPEAGGGWNQQRERIQRIAPLLHDHFPRRISRDKEKFKARAALAINALIPHYDLVVIDECHHFKHGRSSSAARNKMLAIALGAHSPRSMGIDIDEGEHFRKRFDRLLCLSATPVEADFQQLYNQLDLLGFGEGTLELLKDPRAAEEAKSKLAKEFLIRRLTSLAVAGDHWTRNMYRREWRAGGMRDFDEPMAVPDDRQRLIVALIQRKLAELINRKTFGRSFQIGMLASFESFEESATSRAKLPPAEDTTPTDTESAEASAFDDPEQTEDLEHRRGIDRGLVAGVADSYRERFGTPLPHPKMDAVVESLSGAFDRAEKALVFVRRVRSVPELVLKLGDAYDEWLERYLREALSPELHEPMAPLWAGYRAGRRQELHAAGVNDAAEAPDGANDTFFSWFFQSQTDRGEVLTGTKFRENRLMNPSSAFSTFFEDNHVAALLGFPADVAVALANVTAQTPDAIREAIRWVASQRVADRASPGRFNIHHAVQEGALRQVATSDSELGKRARIMADVLYGSPPPTRDVRSVGVDIGAYLGATTFFSALRRRATLCEELWPHPDEWTDRRGFQEQELRRELLAGTARLGHTLVDLYALAVSQAGTLELGGQQAPDDRIERLIEAFLDRLEALRDYAGVNAHMELAEVGRHHDLIVAINFPDARDQEAGELRTYFGKVLGKQVPVAGMYGAATERAVRHFRMPGYPLVLVTTDVLQEGEDLHSFCSRIVHYGVSWTPSSMEQRTGRIDRIGSQVHRRLEAHGEEPSPEALLQVHYPHLEETVEREQVRVVLERMNRFMELMHQGFSAERYRPDIDLAAEALRRDHSVAAIEKPLVTAFPVRESDLHPPNAVEASGELSRAKEVPAVLHAVFERVLGELQAQCSFIQWMPRAREFLARGVASIANRALVAPSKAERRQAFQLRLVPSSPGADTLVECTSVIGELPDDEESMDYVEDIQCDLPDVRLSIGPARSKRDVRLDARSALLFDPETTQAVEVIDLIERVALGADLVETWLYYGEDHAPGTWER
jgi:hypothetical protein